jgi:uncharacterized membrane protein
MSEEAKTEAQKRDIDTNRDVAAFSYFLILSPVLLFTRRDSPFIQFHARQATVLFVLLIIIALLPGRLSYLNFLTVALAITGLMQANQGRRWRAPVIAQALEAGVSADAVWHWLKSIADTLRRAFVRGAKQPLSPRAKTALKAARAADLEPLTALIADHEARLAELEKAVVITRHLTGKCFSELPPETQTALQELLPKLRPFVPRHQFLSADAVLELYDRKSGRELLLGGFNEKKILVAAVFWSAADIRCGSYRIRAIDLDDTPALDALAQELTASPEPETKTPPDSPVSGLA